MYSDGEVYRAISNVAGVIPPTHIDKWAHVPFPAVFAQYAAYMAAADDSDDMEAAKDFRDLAMDFLTREIDSEWIQGTTTTYNFGNYSNTVPCGTNWYALSTAATSTITTISDKCLDEWGSILPT